MVDVTDRMGPSSRYRGPMVREGSGLSGSSSTGGNTVKDLKQVLAEVEPLEGVLTPREVDEIMQATAKIVGDNGVEWTKRLNMLKTFRSLCCDPTHHAQIVAYIRHLSPPLQAAVKDLRSQLGREACITVALIAQQLGTKAEVLVEPMLPTLFSLLVANAKIVSITGAATIIHLYENIHSWRLLPPLQAQMSLKSKEVRRAVCSCVRIILNSWPPHTMQKHAHIINEVMKKGLIDADAEARNISRDSFPVFQQLFPGLAKSILDSLEPLQKRQLLSSINLQSTNSRPAMVQPMSAQRTNGTMHQPHQTSSLSRQGSIKKTGIPILAARTSPARTATPGRSTSAIDLQAANRAKQHHFSTLSRTPLRTMGRTNSSMTPNSAITGNGAGVSPYGISAITPPTINSYGTPNSAGAASQERSRNRSKISRISHSQPGSRSNSPSSKLSYTTYSSPYSQFDGRESHLPVLSPPGKAGRRYSATSSASSSRDTSPQGRMASRLRSRSITQSPQVIIPHGANSTARLLMASREAEVTFMDAFRRERDPSELDYGNHSDSEDSMTSHRSFLSETFSPPISSRPLFVEDNVEELLNKCGSAKWSERKEGLLGLQNYLQRHGSLPPQYFNRIGQTFCRIFMDAHTKVLSLFLDVLHAVLARHAKDLVDFTTILLNRVLTKLGSDLLTSVQTKLMKTLEIIMEEMPADLQFSAVAHYLCDPTQTPNSRSRVAALCHLYNLSSVSTNVKVDELMHLVEKMLDWCGDVRSPELRKMSQKVFHALFDMAAPQMTLVLGSMPPHKQDQAKMILKNHVPSDDSPRRTKPVKPPYEERVNLGGEWNAINSEMQSLKISQNDFENDLMAVITQMSMSNGSTKGTLAAQLLAAIKDSNDQKLIEHHKEVLKVIFDTLTETTKAGDKAVCFYCLEELCNRTALATHLAAFAELLIVRVTDVQTNQMPREVTKAAENCGMSLAINFPPEILTRALCPIVQNRETPVNIVAIKMLQRMCDSCDVTKLRALFPDIISTLIVAYDHSDSAVRKAAVFAIVSIHTRLGSELDPYLTSLSGSKLKLLQLYIQRAHQNQNHQGGNNGGS